MIAEGLTTLQVEASARGQTRDGNARSTQRVFKIFFEQIYP
jgi:hypothetical protein